MPTDVQEAAIRALREATRAVTVGEAAVANATPPEDREPDLAHEVAHLLEATAHLLRSTDLDAVPLSSVNRRLHAVAQHLSAGAELARRTDAPDGSTASPSHSEGGGPPP